MLLTTLAFSAIILFVWKWTVWKVIAFVFFALPLDILFFAATVSKLPAGHFVTLGITLAAAGLMASWYYGNRRLMQRAQRIDIPLEDFVELVSLRSDLHLQKKPAIFFQHLPFDPAVRITPFALLQQVQMTSMLFQPAVVVEFITAPTPRVAEDARITVHEYGHGITVVHLTFGYWEQISVTPVIQLGLERGWWTREEELVYFSVREILRLGADKGFPLPMKWMLRFLHQFDQRLIRTLGLEPARCVELGVSVAV
jgi:KUP system potassium uptake protein